MTGSEASSTRRSRKCREKQKTLQSNTKPLLCNGNATIGNTEIEKETELEKEKKQRREDSPASPPAPKEVRHRYGEYNNVLLSDTDMEKLKAELPGSYQDYIERLSSYMAAKGTGYKNHLAIPILWEQVQAFVQQQAGRWWRAWRRTRPTLEVDDLYQCGHPALVEAVKTYKHDEGNSFLGWFMLYLRTEFSVEVGCRTAKQRNEPLNSAVSVDTPIGGENDDFTIGDTLADPVDRYAPIEDEVCNEQVKPVIAAALDDLPERERQVLNLRYMENLPWAETGKRLGVTLTYANAIGKDAIRHIREGSHMQALSEAFYHTKNLYNGTGLHAWQRTGSSAQETFVMKKERDDARARRWLHSDNPEQQLRYYMDYLGFSRELAEKIVEVRNKE